MAESLVLAIEPDLRQAAILKRIVREKALAQVAVVDSRDAAIQAMRTSMPDVLLLSALLSPRDEDELIAHLRTLENAGHLQTHTIPQLASTIDPEEEKPSRGLLSAFRRKKAVEPVATGCDPDLFADEIRVFLKRAAEKKRELMNGNGALTDIAARVAETPRPAAADSDSPIEGPASSWSSPFEWKPSGGSERPAHRAPAPQAPKPPASVDFEPLPPIAPMHEFALPDPAIVDLPAAEIVAAQTPVPESVMAAPAISEPELPAPLPMAVSAIVEPVAVAEPAVPAEPVAVAEALVAAEPVHAEPAVLAEPPAPEPVIAEPPVPEIAISEPRIVDVPAAAAPRATHELDLALLDAALSGDTAIGGIEVIDSAPDTPDLQIEAAPAAASAQEPDAVVIDLDAAPVEQKRPKTTRQRASKSRKEAPAPPETPSNVFDRSEWTRDPRAEALERLGPLARWARVEAPRPKDAPVTADDVRALISSLAVPVAVAWVSYPRGCRIRRVRVPPASESRGSDSIGAVILSRRLLAEQREKRPNA